MSSPSAAMVATELVSHPHLGVLADYVRRLLLQTAEARDPSHMAARPDPETAPTTEQAETERGNVLAILEHGPRGAEERALVAALLAHGVARDLPGSDAGWHELTARLAWLGAYTPFVTFDALEVLLRERSQPLFETLGRLAQAPASFDAGRPEALVAAAALASSGSEMARRTAALVARQASDPLVSAASRADGPPDHEPRVTGELRASPTGPLLTILLAVTGLLLLARGLDLAARWALGLRRPAEVRLTRRGLELASSMQLLGRVLMERKVVVPLGQLARVTREVKYSGLGLYAGLVALAVGSYFGIGLLVDGVRVPGTSPPLLGLGALLVVAGLMLDFGLSRLSDAARGQCRLVLVPRKGRTFCVGGLDLRETDQMLRHLARGASEPAEAGPGESLGPG